MAEKKKMSVADILAAARAQSGAATPSAVPAESPRAESPQEKSVNAAADEHSASQEATEPGAVQPAAAKSPAAKAGGAKPGAAAGRPSVAEIMAMARAKNAGPAERPPEAKKPAAKDAAVKTAVAKAPAAKNPAAKPAAAKPAVRDTASILAAARSGTKPGPVSKAEAAPGLLERPARGKEKAAIGAVAAVATKAPPRAVPPMPVRPAKPAPKKAAEGEEDRRGFLQTVLGSFLALGFTALSATGGLFTLGLARFMFPNVLAEPPSRFKVGFKEGFPSGKVETKFVAQYGVWVVNGEFQGQQQIYALKTVCTHLGCTPNWLEA